eukprot:11686732-Prorocentrum_lima.AAC.1
MIALLAKKKLPKEVLEHVEKVTNQFSKSLRRYLKTDRSYKQAHEQYNMMQYDEQQYRYPP